MSEHTVDWKAVIKPLAVLSNGRRVQLPFRVECDRVDSATIYRVAVALPPGSRGLTLARVRLLEADLRVPDLAIYKESYYMPGEQRGFFRLHAGRPHDVPRWWGASRGDPMAALSHPFTVLNLPRRKRLIGFASEDRFESYVVLDTSGRSIALSTWCELEGRKLAPGQWLELEQLFAIDATRFNDTVDAYARYVAKRSHARVPSRTVTGWSDWQYWREEKCEADLRRSLPVLADLRRRGLGAEHVILDGGWCDFASEWLAPCSKYPSGMKKLSALVRRNGLKLGLWLAPFITNVNTQVARRHRQWMVLQADNSRPLKRTASNVGPCYTLDYTVPAALEWLRKIVRTFVRDYRIGYLKLDGPCLAHYAGGRFHDPSQTRIQQIRAALEVIRQECGQDVIVEGEGIYLPSVGLVDTQRTTQDNHPFWYFPHTGQPSLQVNLRNDLLGGYMHNVYWHNHRENVIIRDFLSPFHAWRQQSPELKDTMLTDNEIRCYLSAATLVGGAMLVTEPMEELARGDRMDLLHRFLPHVEGGRAQVLDAFAHDGDPTWYGRRIETPFEIYHVLGAFNWGDLYADRELSLRDYLGAGKWHVFDYWAQRYLGQMRDRLSLPNVPAHGCRIVAVRPALNRPQVVGSNLHILQGAVEFDDVQYQDNVLSIRVGHPVQREAQIHIRYGRTHELVSVETNARSHLIDARIPGLLTIHFDGRRHTQIDIRWRAAQRRR